MKLQFFLLGLLSSVMSFELEDSGEKGVTFGNKSQFVQPIFVDENNDGGKVNFVKVSGIVGTITATDNSDSKILNIEVVAGGDPTECYISTTLVDYESIKDVQTAFVIAVVDDGSSDEDQMISLQINNIDDEVPVLFGSICLLKEETFYDATNSTCVYHVSDPDGLLSEMDFSAIAGNFHEDDLFEFKYKEEPADDVYEADVYLVLKEGKKLDYESVSIYDFRENATDGAGHPTSPQPSVTVVVEVEDVPDQPPEWVTFRAVVDIADDTQPTQIQVLAIDGDFEINSTIMYGVIDQSGFVHIDGSTGLITVDPIPKDVGVDQIEFYAIALEEDDPNSNVVSKITLLILY